MATAYLCALDDRSLTFELVTDEWEQGMCSVMYVHVLQTEMYSVMTVSSEPPGSLGWLFFTLVLKSAFAVIWLKCVSVAIISIEPPRL